MPKMKTDRGAAKRFKVTGTGKLRRRKAFRSHILEKKPSTRTRRLAHMLHPRQHLRAHVLDKVLHLPVHRFHPLPHLQDDRDPGNVHAQIARQVQDELQPLEVLVRVEPRVAFRPRRLQQALALVQAERLRMNFIHLGHRRDHVRAFGLPFCRHIP